MDKVSAVSHYLTDYQVSNFLIDQVHLHFDLNEDETIVKSVLSISHNPSAQDHESPLILDGEQLMLLAVKIDGKTLSQDQYQVEAQRLIIHQPPEKFILETEVMIKPQENTELSGLYKSSGNFCSHCESQGFRRITYYLDRPDIMARFTTTISANKAQYPILLANGNLIESRELPSGRHWVHWEDPSLKPCYLFALVAGDFDVLADQFVTMSGKTVALRLYLEKGYKDQGDFALEALKRAMKWDEQRFGREYDLNDYMIVAVSDFTMGAMENKGLNIFNTKYILAKEDTATDQDYINVLKVVGHEYFHNWSGNRITCRDWFQITLKEGLTVFREQLFSEDETHSGTVRIDEVNIIKNQQFLEDSGPNAHPIRPESYIEVNNFYTMTVYHKGSEVIRMVYTMLGREGFRKAMDLYFSRYDGQAVTTEDFLQAMADASQKDLSQFKRWYWQAGTPELKIHGNYDAAAKTFQLTVEQSCLPTSKQSQKQPFHLPLAVGLVNAEGSDMPVQMQDEHQAQKTGTKILEIKQPQEVFTFINVTEKPVPSLLRNFSAPVKLHYPYTLEELAHLYKHDSDPVNQWSFGQQLMTRLLLDAVNQIEQGKDSVPVADLLTDAMDYLLNAKHIDDHLLTRLITLPSELYLSQQVRPVPVTAIHLVSQAFKLQLARSHLDALERRYHQLHQPGVKYHFEIDMMGQRSLKNNCLIYLVASGYSEYADLAYEQFKQSQHMTDMMAALVALNNSASFHREQALAEFYERWQNERLLVNKWLLLQSGSALGSTPQTVRELLQHPAFSLKNPNNVYALIGGFANNLIHFHTEDGSGYDWVTNQVIAVDSYNPQLSARIVEPLTYWYRFDDKRQALMMDQLNKVIRTPKISNNVYELVKNSLECKM